MITLTKCFIDLIYYFKGETTRKRFDDFKKEIKFKNKIKLGDIKQEEAKKLQYVQ